MLGQAAEKYRQDLIDATNQCGLPLALGYYILKDVFLEVQGLYQKDLEKNNSTTVEEIDLIQEEELKESIIDETE